MNEHAAIECRKALFLTDPHVDRESLISAKGTRVAGTCEWITRNESYLAWLHGGDDNDGHGSNHDNTRLLWISGGPGKGKTMLSVFLTEELERNTAGLDGVEVAFFFCSADDKKRNTAIAVLRGLVHQIISKRPQLVKHALPYFETRERTQQSLLSLETLWVIFSKLVADARLGKMFCVLDGLDECEESTMRVILPRIVDLIASATPSLPTGTFRLAIVSRNMPGLQGCTRIRLDPDNDEKVVSDIELFVSARVGELSRIEGFNDDRRASVQSALLERAEGTFLWVGFVMHELLQKRTCTDILEALKELPSGLPAVYGRMIQRIPATDRRVSRAIFCWATLAVRPLQLGELAAAVGRLEEETRDLITHCGPLLKIQDHKVSLVHQSARDYLLRRGRDSNAVLEKFRLHQRRVHLRLAQQCLDCIRKSHLKYRPFKPATKPDRRESPLLHYAVLYWPEHAKGCSALATKLFDSHRDFLQEKSSLRIHWWETYRETIRLHRLECPPLLHMACFLDIIPWIEAILAKQSWKPRFQRRVNKKDEQGNTPLHWAVYQGSEAVVRLLLDRGADLEAKNCIGWTALHCTFSQQNKGVIRLLLDRGADVNTKDNSGKTALHVAAKWEKEAVVRLLIEKGADIEAKDKFEKTALCLAARAGSEVMVRLLIEKGADIKAKTNNGLTLLHDAARAGREAVVRFLIQKGADVNAKDKNGQTVLHCAVGSSEKVVVQLLVEKGADIKAQDKIGQTVLHCAAEHNDEAMLRLLVEKGADVQAETNDGETVLQIVTQRWNPDVVAQLLVDLGAEIKAKDK